MRLRTLIPLGVALLFVAAFVVARANRDVRAQPQSPPTDSSTEQPVAKPSKRAFLESYFGDRWPEIAAQLSTETLDGDASFDASLVPPWDEVKQQLTLETITDESDRKREIDQALSWTDGVFTDQVDFNDVKYNPFHRRVSELDAKRLRSIAAGFDAQLQVLGEQAALAFAAAMTDLWKSDRYNRAPIVPPPARREGRKLRCLRTYFIDNWHIVFSFYAGDYPEYDACRAAITSLKMKRLTAVGDEIKNLP